MFKTRVTLFDSTEHPSYEEYVEMCKANHVDPHPDGSNDYWDHVADTMQMWHDDFFKYNINDISENDRPCLISGELGLWDGNHEIAPVKCRNLRKAINKCIGSCDYFEVEFENGVIHVAGYHHDGVNVFDIQLLSAHGERVLEGLDFGETVPFEIKKYMTKMYHIKR